MVLCKGHPSHQGVQQYCGILTLTKTDWLKMCIDNISWQSDVLLKVGETLPSSNFHLLINHPCRDTRDFAFIVEEWTLAMHSLFLILKNICSRSHIAFPQLPLTLFQRRAELTMLLGDLLLPSQRIKYTFSCGRYCFLALWNISSWSHGWRGFFVVNDEECLNGC